MANVFQWSRALLSYVVNSSPVARVLPKAGANAVVANSAFAIQDATLRLQQGALDLDEWTAIMRRSITNQEVAVEALARGGWSQVRPSDYVRASQRVEAQFGFLRGMQERIVAGYYGPTLEANGILNHASQYSGVARASYENVLMQVGKESGHDGAERVKGANDHCDDCVEWAALGRIPLDEMMDNYPIGASVCGGRCHCIIVTGRD